MITDFIKTYDLRMLAQLDEVALEATCPRKSVGAIVEIGGHVIVKKANTVHPGGKTCREVGCRLVSVDGVQTCTRVLHSERAAIFEAAKLGYSIDGATIYVTLSPCLACAQAIACSGISRVVYKEDYKPSNDVLEMLRDASVAISKLENGSIVEI